jgi:hypothetical protein
MRCKDRRNLWNRGGRLAPLVVVVVQVRHGLPEFLAVAVQATLDGLMVDRPRRNIVRPPRTETP